MYGSWVFPADAEYEFRLRIANFRGGDVVVTSNNGPGRTRRRHGAEDAPPGGRRGGRAPLTPEQFAPVRKPPDCGSPAKADHQCRWRSPSSRKSSKAPPHSATIAASSPPRSGKSRRAIPSRLLSRTRRSRRSAPEYQSRQRRGLFVDYLEIVGPFNPSKSRRRATADLHLRPCPGQTHRPSARARSSTIWCAAPTGAP